jgi:hypothetical protein
MTDDSILIQPKITGYRQLSEADAALMNEAKALAERCGAFIAKLQDLPSATSLGDGRQAFKDGELVHLADGEPSIDMRWLHIGKTDLQRGFMAVIRSIAQPTTF